MAIIFWAKSDENELTEWEDEQDGATKRVKGDDSRFEDQNTVETMENMEVQPDDHIDEVPPVVGSEDAQDGSGPQVSCSCVDNQVQAAMLKARELYEFVNLDPKTCHCECKLFEGSPYIEQFDTEMQNEIRLNVQELTEFKKDLVLIGMISQTIKDKSTTERSRKANTERQHTRLTCLRYGSKRICRY